MSCVDACPSFTDIRKNLKGMYAPSKTLTGKEVPATELKDYGVNLDKIGRRLSKYRQLYVAIQW